MRGALPVAILDQLSLTGEEVGIGRWTSFSEREWIRALAWLDLSGLAIYFLDQMHSAGGFDVLPASIRWGLERRREDNRLRTVEIVRELGTLSSSFESASARYAVLKGLALAGDYYPDPAFRTQYDHDFLLDPKDLDVAASVLGDAGYKPRGGGCPSVVVYRRPEPRIRFPATSTGLYSPRLDRSVEIHLTLWEEDEDRVRIMLPTDFLDRSVPRRWDGIGFIALSDEDSLLFQVLHAFRHILRNWCRLSIFLEIGHFLKARSSDTEFWSSFAERIEGIRWAREASLLIFTLAERVFRAQMPDDVRAMLSTNLSPALNLWIDRYGHRAALSNFNRDKSSLFLHREFVDIPSHWAAIRRRRLLPVHRPHRPPAVVFQRGFSSTGKFLMESTHAVRRLKFHSLAGVRYALEYPRWVLLRRLRLAAALRGA